MAKCKLGITKEPQSKAGKYMLVEVVERGIEGIVYSTLEEAQSAMREAYEETVNNRAAENDISEWWAWVNDGPNHDNYDWKILEI